MSNVQVQQVQKPARVSWDRYFLNLAYEVATRGTCDRKRVGAVIVVNRRIVCTGYNGSLRGQPHCDDAGHELVENHCIRTVHSESNAVAQAAQHGISVHGGDLYVTCAPCLTCFKLVVNAGIKSVTFGEGYRSDTDLEHGTDAMKRRAEGAGIRWTHLGARDELVDSFSEGAGDEEWLNYIEPRCSECGWAATTQARVVVAGVKTEGPPRCDLHSQAETGIDLPQADCIRRAQKRARARGEV